VGVSLSKEKESWDFKSNAERNESAGRKKEE
jgi:hypothetical protein